MIHTMKKRPTVVAAARQAGLTLIELTIVLLILIGLSGLLLPFVQGFVDKTHDSANADSLKEVSKQIESYNNLYSSYPEDLDSLIVGQAEVIAAAPTVPFPAYATGAGKDEIYSGMMNKTLFTATAITAPMITQFNNSGISKVKVFKSDAGPGNHTLQVTDAGSALIALTSAATSATTSFTGADLGVLAALDPTKLAKNLGAKCSTAAAGATATAAEADACLAELLSKPKVDTTANTYFVMGIGNDASLVGRTMAEAPIHFAKVGGMNAANRYNRILAVFEVQTAAPLNGHMAAKFMGTLMPMMKVEGLGQAQGSYYAGDGA